MRLSFCTNGSAAGALEDEALTADLLDWAEKQRRKVADDRRTGRCRRESTVWVAPKTPIPPNDRERDHQWRTAWEAENSGHQSGHVLQQTCVRQVESQSLDGAKSTGATVVVLALRNGRRDQGEAFLFDDAQEARSFIQALVDSGLDHERITAVSGPALGVKLTHRPAVELGLKAQAT